MESAIGYHHNEMHCQICSEKPQEPQYNWSGLKTLIPWIWNKNSGHHSTMFSPQILTV